VKRKPDVMLILAAAFAVGVLLTLLLPLAANDSIADPASALEAGVLLTEPTQTLPEVPGTAQP
jgi:hypothetical protein